MTPNERIQGWNTREGVRTETDVGTTHNSIGRSNATVRTRNSVRPSQCPNVLRRSFIPEECMHLGPCKKQRERIRYAVVGPHNHLIVIVDENSKRLGSTRQGPKVSNLVVSPEDGTKLRDAETWIKN